MYSVNCNTVEVDWANIYTEGTPLGLWKPASTEYTKKITIKFSAAVEYKHSSIPAVIWHPPLDSWKLSIVSAAKNTL